MPRAVASNWSTYRGPVIHYRVQASLSHPRLDEVLNKYEAHRFEFECMRMLEKFTMYFMALTRVRVTDLKVGV